MRFMVIETFRGGDPAPVYARLAERGRMIPEGVRYIDSWVEEGGGRCFQIMECERRADLDPWIEVWADLADFEVVPVVDSATAAEKFGR
ncbi:DUF3303 domain-containing protein [Pelagibius marinus]|uniref:DUF3303 domain-containing protein n=1 Tax=Pelagibius marinus TaxID=2762760 RepID=UPI0018728828|nr:DUF3303 family protein [Pelagibius marinus]